MSQLTKNAIITTTLKLAEKKPFSRITVKDITAELGITRNTFYYHFHDIYDVVTSYISDVFIAKIKEADKSNYTEAVMHVAENLYKNRKALSNIYKAMGFERLSQFLGKQTQEAIVKIVKAADVNHVITEQDAYIISTFYEHALGGILLNWLKDSKPQSVEDMRDNLNRIIILFDGQIEQIIENAAKADHNEQVQ